MPPAANVNNMKKFLPVIIGLIVGIIVSTGLIVIEKNRVAYGEEGVNWWNSMVAGADNDWFDWQDVFTPLGPSEKGKNLYNLIYKKLTRQAGKDALIQVAKNNGLTVEEARAVVNGSFAPILNNPKYSKTLTQDNAAKIMARMQENFADLSELYQVQQEVDVSIAPGEMFANGDLSDSGFDLVKDLSLMEEILFVKKSPQTIGGAFADPYGSPYNPTEDDKIIADYVPNEFGVAYLPLKAGAGGAGVAGKKPGAAGVINIGDKKVEAEVLDKDICDPLNNLGGGLADYEKKHAEGKKDDGGGNGGVDEDGGDGDGDDDDGSDGGGDDSDDDGVPTGPKTKAAPADDWAKEWCANYKEPGVFAGIGASGFKSLGGVSTNYIFGGNAAANYDNNLVKMNLGVCFDIKLIPKKVSSFLPGDTCILCEVEKINQFLDKTLSHTLMPNKVTGNLMESAKCKNSGTFLNLQFIVIWNPVPTPINDKLIFGKNLFEEWNKFLSRYQPILSTKQKNNYEIDERPDLTDDFNIELQKKMMPATVSQSAMVSSINKIKAEAAAEASLKLKTVEIGNEVANTMVYSRSILQEIKQMNALFENFRNTFETTNKEALKKIVNDKPNVK